MIVSLTAIRKIFQKTTRFNKASKKLKLRQNNSIFQEFENLYGLDALESLQYHENTTVYDQAFYLLENYFEIDHQMTTGIEEPDVLKLLFRS